MLEVKQRTIQVAELEQDFVVEIHEVKEENEDLVEVWIYNKAYDTKIHAFSILKANVETPIKLYQYIEEHAEEFMNQYKEEVMEE